MEGVMKCRDMPMDYDDNEFSIHNVELTEEGSSTVSSVLRPYDFEDGGHISFDSLVENEVFLGITGQEDNQWIEEYSRGTSTGVVESRRDNVWSEAASSESVEMLLKSVGQATLGTESSDEPGSLAKNMDPGLKQDDESNHVQEATVTDKEEERALATEELDVSNEPCSLSINLSPTLKQEDEDKHTEESVVTNKEEEGALATEELDVGDEPGSLAINLEPNLKLDDGNSHAQEAMVTNKKGGALMTEELDASDDPNNLNTNVDPNLKQDDGNNHSHEAMIINKTQDHFSGSNPSFVCEKFYGTITEDSQEEANVSGGELDSDVIGNKCDLSEEKVDGICDDVNHEARHIAVALSDNNLQEDLSTSKIECGNLDASKECNLKRSLSSNEFECSTKNIDNSIGSQTAVDNCSNSDEKPSNVESLDKPPFAVEVSIDEESMPAGSCNLLMTEACVEVSHDRECAVTAAHEPYNDLMHEDLPPIAVEDDGKTKSENLAFLKSNACSPSKVTDVQSQYVEGSEKPDSVFDPSEMREASSINDVGTDMTNMSSSPELITGNMDLVATPKVHSDNSNNDQSPAAKLSGSVPQQVNDEIQSSEQDSGMCIDRNITLHEEGTARLPLDMDIAALDCQQNVESVSSAEGSKAQGSEADIAMLAEPGYIDAKSPPIIGGASLLHHDFEEKKEEGFVNDGTREYESLKVVSSMVDCAPLSVAESGASLDSAGEGAQGTSVENMETIMNDLAEKANTDGLGSCSTLSTVDPIPCDSSAKVGDSVEAGGYMQESISGNHVNMSIEQHVSTAVVLTSEYNDNYMRHEEDDSVSRDKIQSVSPLLNTNNTELSQSTRVEPSEGAINEKTSLSETTEDVVLTSECDGSHMRHGEDSSVFMDKLQSVSPLLDPINTELSQSTSVKPSEGAINENILLPKATKDVALTSECDDIHMRHGEDSSVSMDKLQSVSPLSDTDNTELSESTRVKSSEGAIDENTSLPEATEDVVLTSECDDSHMSHEEDGSVSMEELQSVSPLLKTDDMEPSESTRVKSSECAIDENSSLPKASEDVVLTSKCDDSHMSHEEDGFVSMEKLQSVSPGLNTDDTELSQSTGTKHSEDDVNEKTPLPEAAEDVVLTSQCDYSHTRHEECSSVSMDKLQSVSPLLNTNNTELSRSTRGKLSDGAINENTPFLEAAEDVVLTTECDDSQMRHEEDSSVSMNKLQSVSPLLNTNSTELSRSTRVKPSDGAINENTPLPEAAIDVVVTTECDDSHMRHEEVSTFSMDKLQSVSPLLDTNSTELSRSTRVKPSDGAINENTPVPEAAEDVVITTDCDDSHMRHEEDSSISMDKLQSVSLLNTDNTELSQSTRVEPGDGAINENTPLPDGVLTSECDDSHVRHEENSSVSMDKHQSVSPLLNTNNTEFSQSTTVKSSDGAINENAPLSEAADVVLISECDDSNVRRVEDRFVSMDKPQSVSPLLNTNNTELSLSTGVKPSEGAINENASLPEETKDMQGKEQSISVNRDLKIDKSFTFEVSGTAELREACEGLQLFPASQACKSSTTMEGHCIDSSSSTLDPRQPNEALVVTPQTPGSGTIFAGGKERKTRRKSVGKESVRKGKETATIRLGRVEKSSPLLATPPQPAAAAAAAGHAIQFQELVPKEKIECTVTKPIPISNLPDLNNATCIYHQPFTNNQQVQLRAQILVYGSLISGMPPEEPHMIAAFGQSDAERITWGDAWHACLERANGRKSHASTPAVQLPRSDLKDPGHRSPDLGIKHSSTLSSTNKGSPPAVSPLIPVPSPLWNMSTPSCVGFQSRSVAFQQSFTPIHPPTYQSPPNPLWLSQSPFLGQWGVASSPGSVAQRFSGLPITEAVQLTPVNLSGGGPHAYSMPVVHSSLFSSQSTDGKKASGESKSRKRKKVTAAVSSVPSQVLVTPSAHMVPRTEGHNRIPFLVENQTDSVTAPVVTSIFSTSVTVSTTPASKSSSPGSFLSVHDRPRLGDKTVWNAEDMLKKVEEGNVQEADVNATKIWQTSSDSRSTKRTKVTTCAAVNQTPVSTQASSAVAYLPQVLGNEISLLAQNRTTSVTAPAFCTSLPTSGALATPVSITSDSSPTGRFPEIIYPTVSTHGYPRTGYQNMENALAVEETLSKVKESKQQAENSALLAAAAVSNCQDVWSGLDNQNISDVISDAETKLMSSIAAAATVAKMASAAAQIASNVAKQAKVMADEVFQSSKTENFSHISHSNIVNKATPASVLKSVDKTTDSHPNSIISAAREAARRRIEAASAASKHAENLDAIVKAAELAAEAVSQVGKIVAMSDPSAMRKLAEAGPEGFWKVAQLAYEQHHGGEISGLHLNSNSGKKNVPDVFIEEIQTSKYGQAPLVHLAHNQMKTMLGGGSITSNEKDTRTLKAPSLSKVVGVSTVTNSGSPHTYVVGHHIPQNTPGIWEEHNIKEGCLVEVYKVNGKYKGAWLAANVLSLKDEKALVCYTGIQSSDEENVKEWVAFEVEGSEEVPRIRIAHPVTTMRFEGARKRHRTAVTDYAWSKGDRVDVWMQDCWREGIVVEPNKIDVTSLSVQFPAAQGEPSVVRSWHVRPTLIWKDRKWIEWNGGHASQGETPKEKRMRFGSPAAVNDKKEDKLPMIVESGRLEEQGTLLPLLSAQESCFNVGKSTNKPSSNLRPIQKEKARVVFGVPKPGKKQKFMAVSTQYVDDRSNKNSTTNGSLKFSKPPGVRGSKNDAMENQVPENKSRLKSRKPPVPWFRTSISRDSEPTAADSAENSSSRQNQTQVGSSSNIRRDPAKGPPPKKAFTFTSKPKSEHFNRGKLKVAPKIEVKDKSISQVNEPRRSNRKIQPTSRLLEGLQSSLTISKIPSVSHAGQRKVTPKGNTSHGSS